MPAVVVALDFDEALRLRGFLEQRLALRVGNDVVVGTVEDEFGDIDVANLAEVVEAALQQKLHRHTHNNSFAMAGTDVNALSRMTAAGRTSVASCSVGPLPNERP